MKKMLSLILCAAMTAGLGATALAEQEILIYVNGEIVQSELKPVIIDGNTMIPLRPVAEAMGCEVTWIAEEKGIKIESGEITIRMVIDSELIYTSYPDEYNSGYQDTRVKTINIAPQLINGSTYIPMRPMVESLGSEVTWDGETKTITITYDPESAEDNYTVDNGEAKYIGTTVDGVLTYEYIGETNENGECDGYGKITFSNGCVYEGEFKDGNMEGKGTMTWKNGDVYEGTLSNGLRNGTGKYKFANGDVYEGEYKDGYAEGTGTKTWRNGTVYVGEFKDDKRNGNGTLYYKSGTIYEGEWEDDDMVGYGKVTYSNGECYEGEWKDGKWEWYYD